MKCPSCGGQCRSVFKCNNCGEVRCQFGACVGSNGKKGYPRPGESGNLRTVYLFHYLRLRDLINEYTVPGIPEGVFYR